MKKKIFLFIVSSLLLIGCQNNTTTSSSTTSSINSVEESSSTSIVDSSTTSNSNITTSSNPSSSLSSEETSSTLESNNSTVSSVETQTSDSSSNSLSSTSINSSSSTVVSYDGYYSTISPSMSGETLQKSLTSLIAKNYHDLGYDGLLSAYAQTDCKPGTNIIWDMYSNENFVCGGDKENHQYKKEGDGYNREHSVPQSYFSEQRPMKSDLFHVYPTDGYVNNRRSNFPYGEVNNPTYTSNNGSKVGPSSFAGYNGTVFEPIDEYKGDFARSYFYFATRYPAKATKTANGSVSFSNSYPYLTKYAIDLFTKWSEEDPISQKEIDRNNAVFKLQKNRNPFIDHPEFINKIFGGNTSIGDDVDNGDKEEVKTDQEYASEVIALINSIGTVTASSGSSITNASNAYDKLTDSQKALVTNYQVLLDAKEAYKEFGDSIGDKVIFNMVCEDDNDSFKDGNITFSSNINANGNDNGERGVQFLNRTINAATNNTLILSTNDYGSGVNSVKLTCASNATNFSSITLKVFIGNSELTGEVKNLTSKDNTSYTFTSSISLSGEIRIEVKSTLSSSSFYISTIEIN